MENYSTKILKKTQLTSGIIELVLDKPKGFNFSTGQYLQAKIPDGTQQVLRAYSIASIPEDEQLLLGVKIVKNGLAGEFFRKVEQGAQFEFRGPGGEFFLQDGQSSYYFIGVGIGITPLLSMIRTLLEVQKVEVPVRLLFGLRNEEDLFWCDTLEYFKTTYCNFSYDITLSQPSATWRGKQGRVLEHLDDTPIDADFYVCGSGMMVNNTRMTLLSHNVPSKHIHLELF